MNDTHLSPPFEVGERVLPADLLGWDYTGLSGTPGSSGASRRYTRGMWVMELIAHTNKQKPTRVVTMRTQADDKLWWAERAAT